MSLFIKNCPPMAKGGNEPGTICCTEFSVQVRFSAVSPSCGRALHCVSHELLKETQSKPDHRAVRAQWQTETGVKLTACHSTGSPLKGYLPFPKDLQHVWKIEIGVTPFTHSAPMLSRSKNRTVALLKYNPGICRATDKAAVSRSCSVRTHTASTILNT